MRGRLYENNYQPKLSGHETFPLRYGWLKKAFDAVSDTEDSQFGRSVFLCDDAIARFGVGKNMVASMRHWAVSAGVIEDKAGRATTTQLGSWVFGSGGLDPYMEDPATAWLVHWQLCSDPRKTTWFWAFNHYPAVSFERDILVKGLEKLAKDRGWARVSTSTIKSDVACFVRTYVSQPSSGKASYEDALESPLTELGLIRPVGRRDGFRFVRGRKPTLGAGVFCYAVEHFWSRYSTARTLSFEALAHEPGSPGRVFLLDENALANRLFEIDGASLGAYRWSETAGLKQLIRERDVSNEEALRFIETDYSRNRKDVA
ncbi:MAG: DUF4007 family protein [Acidobacteriota bacterium]|nr:DUF4007 family protein [Acidobacteriota bacterium]